MRWSKSVPFPSSPGGCRRSVMGFVVEWASLHQQELLDDWRRAHSEEPLERIAPLE